MRVSSRSMLEFDVKFPIVNYCIVDMFNSTLSNYFLPNKLEASLTNKIGYGNCTNFELVS